MSRVIAIDIDGTLLTSRGAVLPNTITWLDRARAQGAHVLISSGRPVAGIRRQIAAASLRGPLAVSAYNGAIVQTVTGEVVADHRITAEVARQVFEVVHPMPISRMACVWDDLVVDDPEGHLVREEADGNDLAMVVTDDLRVLATDPHKVLFAGTSEALGRAGDELERRFGESVQVTSSSTRYTELVPATGGKGAALELFCAQVGVPLTDAIAFGDAHNDIGMLAAAGLGVAMGNASPDAMAAADRVTASNDDDGIARVLAEIFG